MRLDRIVQFRRADLVDDGLSQVEDWADYGERMHAAKQDLSDSERWRAHEVSANVTTRFVVRRSSFTSSLTPKDRLVCEGIEYDIAGIKEGKGRRQWLEITASARTDQ